MMRHNFNRLARYALPCLWLPLVFFPAQGRAEQPANGQPEVLTLQETARLLRVYPKTVALMAKKNGLPGREIAPGNWRFSRAAVLAWLGGNEGGLSSLPAKDDRRPGMAVAALAGQTFEASPADRQPEPAPAQAGQPAKASQTATKSLGAKPEGASTQDIALRETKLLLKPGQFLVEPAISYDRQERPILAQVSSGLTGVGTWRGRSLSENLTVRVGGPKDTEFFLGISQLQASQETLIGDEVRGSPNRDLSALSLGARFQAWDEDLRLPGGVVSVQGSIPSSNQPRSVGAGLTLVKSLDPAVLSGSIVYWRSIVIDPYDLTQLTNRDRLSLSLGYAYALNDLMTVSSNLSGTFGRRTQYPSVVVPSSDDFRLSMGMTYALSKKLTVQPSLGFSLGGVGPAMSLSVAFPYVMDIK